MRELLCLCCAAINPQSPDLTSCPSCGCGEHVPADLADTVTITLTKHELRILTFWADNFARRFDGPCTPVKTIVDRLATQTEMALILSQEIADVRAAFPDSTIEIYRGGRETDE